MEASEAETLSSFLMPMLHYYPESRAKASELVDHPWLQGVVVQGELELEERKRKGAAVAGAAGAAAAAAGAENGNGNGNGNENGNGNGAEPKVSLEEITKLGPSVKGMVGMGRI